MFRNLKKEDYYTNYFDLLDQLTSVNKEKITYNKFKLFVKNLNKNHKVIVFEENNSIKATGTIVIEQKLVHGMGKMAHIEDVVIDEKSRKLGLGKKIIQYLIDIAKLNSCYKIILNSKDENIGFYEKCGFKKNINQMILLL